jgi:parvulin-like peptidyl-prolyl isomerase
VSHVLVAYSGARQAALTAVRSKEEARRLAEHVKERAKKGENFGGLARSFSDDPTTKPRGGVLGAFERRQGPQPFAEAAFALKPGDISEVVESEFGFHVIKRDE